MNRIVFAGTPEFALVSLRALVDSGRVPVAVYTQPDRPAGRGRKLTASPVKRYAEEHNIPVYQPATLKDLQAQAEFAALQPDLLVVAAYGLLLPQAVLDAPTHGCVNVHSSLLPRWRGAAPIQAAILAGDAETGISLMSMTAGLDEGPVYCTSTLSINPSETAGELHDRLAKLGGELLANNLDGILAGSLTAKRQDDALANYAPKISTSDAELDWSRPADELARQVRAYNPVPGCWFRGTSVLPQLAAERVKVWRAQADARLDGAAGSVLQLDRDGIVIACGTGALSLTELQAPGKRRATARDFVAQIGH